MNEEKKEDQKQRFAYKEQQKKKEFIRVVNLTKETLARYNWAKWAAADEDGKIWAFLNKPFRDGSVWNSLLNNFMITEEQAFILCGRVPQWEDYEPTPVKL